MSDPRDPHYGDRQADREQRYHDAMAANPRRAIVNCQMCDTDGYRGVTVCDHEDHTAAAARGRALIEAELQKIRARKAEAANP